MAKLVFYTGLESKTGARVAIPVGEPLKVALDEAAKRKRSTVILTNSTAMPGQSTASDPLGAKLAPRLASRANIPRLARHRGHATR